MQGRNQFKIKILFLAGVITAVFCVTPSWSETDAEKMEKAQQEQL